MSKKSTTVAIALSVALLLVGCAEVRNDVLPVPKEKIPIVIDPGSDTYEDTTDEMVAISAEPSPRNSEAKSKNSKNPVLAKDLCTRVGENAIQFSKISSQDSGAPYIARLLDFELIADNRETAKLPAGKELSVVIECRVQIELSTGDRGSVTIYELLDSQGQSRVRWDEYTPE